MMLLTDDPRIYVHVGAVKNNILTGALSPGKPCTPINVLCRRHGGGRQKNAKALRMLEDEAYLLRYEGPGYYVAPEAGHQ